MALLDVLKITYGTFSIDKMIEKYAPPQENNTKKYLKFLHKATGVDDDRPSVSRRLDTVCDRVEEFSSAGREHQHCALVSECNSHFTADTAGSAGQHDALAVEVDPAGSHAITVAY